MTTQALFVNCEILTVGAFTARLENWFARSAKLQRIGIEGEVSGLHEFGNGHIGFTLKEDRALLECVAWASSARAFPEFRDGDKVVAYGGVRVHRERGGYKFYVETMEPAGIGDLWQQYQRLKEQFEKEGLFAPDRKRPLPPLPLRIALITARGKAKQDFEQTLRRDAPFVAVSFVESRVQGHGAEVDIADALDRAARTGADAIVLTRGGGTYEDLFPFNLEPVVRAIVRSKIPVMTAIGHSSDHHLADAAADGTFGTPSLAAEFIAKGWTAARSRVRMAATDLDRGVRAIVLRSAERLHSACAKSETAALRLLEKRRAALAQHAARLERRNPQRLLVGVRARLSDADRRLAGAVARCLARDGQRCSDAVRELKRAVERDVDRRSRRVQQALAALDRNDPLRPLRRGYAIVSKDGRAVRDAASVRAGDGIAALLGRGILHARVESVAVDVRDG